LVKYAGLKVGQYTYYNPKTLGFDFEGMIENLRKLEDNAAILLHTCAHNPTGVDPT